MASTDALHGHQAIYERTYKTTISCWTKSRKWRIYFHLLIGNLPMIEDLFDVQKGLEGTHTFGQTRSLFGTKASITTDSVLHIEDQSGLNFYTRQGAGNVLHRFHGTIHICIGSKTAIFFRDGSELIGANVHERHHRHVN